MTNLHPLVVIKLRLDEMPVIDVTVGAFHLGKKPGNFGGSESGISDW